MVRRSLRGEKKSKKRTPGGRLASRVVKTYGQPECARCKSPLPGTAKGSASEMKNLRKSRKVPSRMYAGVLCGDCVDSMVRYVTRMEAKYGGADMGDLDFRRDLTIEKYLPSGWFSQVQGGRLIWNREEKRFRRGKKPETKEAPEPKKVGLKKAAKKEPAKKKPKKK